MNAPGINGAKALDVSIDIRAEAGGFVSAYAYRLDGVLIVMTPPCDTQDGAIAIAKAMYMHGKLAIPENFGAYGMA